MARVRYIYQEFVTPGESKLLKMMQREKLISWAESPRGVVIARYGVNKTTLRRKLEMRG
jgi:hypothetical protein